MPFEKGNKLGVGAGGGRPKAGHTLQSEAMRATLIELVHKRIKPIVNGQIASAEGLQVMMTKDAENKWTQVINPDEVERLLNSDCKDENYYQIWTKNPETNAAKYLLDQAVGKPKETIDANITGSLSLVQALKGADDEQ